MRRCGQINYNERDPLTMDAEAWGDYWASLKVNAVLLNGGGIVAFYPTQVPYHHRSEFLGSRDLFGEMVAVMKGLGLPASHVERARFSEFRPLERLVLAIMMDFLPGVAPYEGTLTVDFFPSGEWVRMVVTLSPMHDEEFTKMASEGLASQFRNLDKLFQGRNQ